MDKLLTFPGKTDKGIFTFVIDAERNFLEKTAAEYHPTIAAYINNAKPIKGKTQLLITALGAMEWWGDNANADAFPESELAHEGLDYGYKTFEHFAKVYKHHINKDPARSYGDVLLAVYNPLYHRVELIVAIDHASAPDIIARIENGEYPEWSMGCRIPFDICNVCGNRAKTRAQYCEHMRYTPGRIDPQTGKKCFVINIRPKFFDISQVLIGADKIAKTLKKVAHPYYGNIPIISSAYLAEKAAEQKKAEMVKEIPPNQPPASAEKVETLKNLARSISEVKAMEQPLPDKLLDDLAKHPLSKVLSTMAMMGIMPKPQEFQKIFLISSGHAPLAHELASKNVCFDPLSVEEPTDEHYKSIGLSYRNFDDIIMQKLAPFMADRSYAAPHLGRRIVIMIKQGHGQKLPRFIKIANEGESKPLLGPAAALLAAAGAYIALSKIAPKETLSKVEKILSTPAGTGLAALLGWGLVKTFTSAAAPNVRGQYSPANSVSNPDSSDVFSRIETLKQKPFTKTGEYIGPRAKGLFLGIPAVYMASGVLQKHRELNPYDEEGRIKSFVRQNPGVISVGLIADALLSAHKHPISSRNVYNTARGLFKGGESVMGKFAQAAMIADEILGTDLLKTADAQDFLSQAVLWPLAMGKANLPGRIVGGLFDQAVLETGSRLMKKKREQTPD